MIRDVVLRTYQEEAMQLGVDTGRALIALVMGAGKTVVSLATIEELVDRGEIERGLVIVPSSLKFQWQRAILRHTGQRALVIDGDQKTRAMLYRYAHKFRYVILSDASVRGDWAPKKNVRTIGVRDLEFDYIILDEATMIKNPGSQISKHVKFLGKRAMVRLALTGQPIENRPEELFSICEFVDDTVLGPPKEFDRTFIVRDDYGRMRRARNLPVLRRRLAGLMYRKTRKDIADQFPAIVTTTTPFELSDYEKQLYRHAVGFTLEKLYQAQEHFGSGFNVLAHYGHDDDPAAEKVRGDIMSGILMMRFVCGDPAMLKLSAERYRTTASTGSLLAASFDEAGLLEDIPEVSTKRAMFREQLEEVLGEDPRSKVVAFTTFKDLIDSVRDDCAGMTESVIFTGDMNARQKDAAMQQFKFDPKTRLFLSSDAGGYGVDIPEANYLFSLDLPWSTGKYEQRESRIIRISSEWEHVTVGIFMGMRTIEERIHNMIEEKRGIAGAFLDGKHDVKGTYVLSLDSLTEFLETSLV